MDDPVFVAVEIPALGDPRRKQWAKVVRSVDTTKATGWAFEGDFIAAGGIQDVAAGSVVVVYGERGSRANPRPEAGVFVVHADATVTPVASATGKAWARTLRDEVEQLLSDPPRVSEREWDPMLMTYSREALEDELARREARDSSGSRVGTGDGEAEHGAGVAP